MFIGLLFTFLIPETKGKSLEQLSDEDGAQVGGAGNGHADVGNERVDQAG